MTIKVAGAIAGLAALSLAATLAFGQEQGPPPEQAPPPAPSFTPEQLDSLVAPVALYPDSLLSQVLVACTYPLEVVEAYQWLQQNRNLTGQALMQAAQQQNWDPSIQALVAFPDLLGRLSQDVNWITQLGNAFLAQQADVMDAVQRMRRRAEAAGRLHSGPQVNVETENSPEGQPIIQILPADPGVVYVPVYNPAYVWGDVPYPYPPIYYPGMGVGIGWGFGIHLGLFFGPCCGWGGWGWGPNWFDHDVIVNNYFFHRYGFEDFHGGPMMGQGVWQHDPIHRWGVPYPNQALAQRFRGAGPGGFRAGGFERPGGPGFRGVGPVVRGGQPGGFGRVNPGGGAFRGPGGGFRNPAIDPRRGTFGGRQGGIFGGRPGGFNRAQPRFNGPTERFGGRQIPVRPFENHHSIFGGGRNGGFARIQSDHGFASMGPRRAFGGFGGGRMAMPRMSAPRMGGRR